MKPRLPTAYPWQALDHVGRAVARQSSRARRTIQGSLDLRRVATALSELIESEVSVIVRRVTLDPPRRRPRTELSFELAASGALCTLALEPELATCLLGRVLKRPIALSTHDDLDDALSGALHALVLELARRCSAGTVLHVLGPSDAATHGSELYVEATVLVAGIAYQAVATVSVPELTISEAPPLAALGELPIALTVVVGWSLAERAAIWDFVPGNAWFPGDGLWLDTNFAGPVALASAGQDWGIAAALSPDGKIVLRGERVQLLPEAGELMSDSEKSEGSLSEAVLSSPLVVRVELGTVSLTAREWAELAPGDIIETGQRMAEPVVLRIAGREVARGELVNLEGELGVRIRELVGS